MNKHNYVFRYSVLPTIAMFLAVILFEYGGENSASASTLVNNNQSITSSVNEITLPTTLVSTIPIEESAQPVEQISINNVNELSEVFRLGRGTAVNDVWSANGETLVVAGAAGIWIYDTVELENEPHLLEIPVNPLAIALSPDGELFATALLNSVNVWDISTGTQVSQLPIAVPALAVGLTFDLFKSQLQQCWVLV